VGQQWQRPLFLTDIFGRQYTVIDNVERLPERLPELFITLTK